MSNVQDRKVWVYGIENDVSCMMCPAFNGRRYGCGTAREMSELVKRMVDSGYEVIRDVTPDGKEALISSEHRELFSFCEKS